MRVSCSTFWSLQPFCILHTCFLHAIYTKEWESSRILQSRHVSAVTKSFHPSPVGRHTWHAMMWVTWSAVAQKCKSTPGFWMFLADLAILWQGSKGAFSVLIFCVLRVDRHDTVGLRWCGEHQGEVPTVSANSWGFKHKTWNIFGWWAGKWQPLGYLKTFHDCFQYHFPEHYQHNQSFRGLTHGWVSPMLGGHLCLLDGWEWWHPSWLSRRGHWGRWRREIRKVRRKSHLCQSYQTQRLRLSER